MKIYRFHCYTSGFPVMKQVHLEWVIHKLDVILFSCLFILIFFQNHEITTTSIGYYYDFLSRIMQLYFAHKQLLNSPVFM